MVMHINGCNMLNIRMLFFFFFQKVIWVLVPYLALNMSINFSISMNKFASNDMRFQYELIEHTKRKKKPEMLKHSIK